MRARQASGRPVSSTWCGAHTWRRMPQRQGNAWWDGYPLDPDLRAASDLCEMGTLVYRQPYGTQIAFNKFLELGYTRK